MFLGVVGLRFLGAGSVCFSRSTRTGSPDLGRIWLIGLKFVCDFHGITVKAVGFLVGVCGSLFWFCCLGLAFLLSFSSGSVFLLL